MMAISWMKPIPRRHPAPRQHGFTLVELVIVVAVIGILAAVAYPSYTEYVRRGYRAEARAGLMQAAQWMERASTASGAYPSSSAFAATPLAKVASNTYVIAIQDRTDSTYILKATPQNAQRGDRCGNFTLEQSGLRGANGKNANAADFDGSCWSQ